MTAYLPRTVMITGATGGFGTAFARRFARAGCRLIVTSRCHDRLAVLTQELDNSPIHGIILDIRNRKAIETMIDDLPDDFAQIDLLINNAGLALGQEPAQETDLDDWEAMIDTNNKGLVICTRLVLPGMIERHQGHIINIGSIAGTFPYPGGHVYCASKAFVQQFSLALRADLLGTNVRVTTIEPGMVETNFSLVRFKGNAQKAAQVYAHTTPLTAEDVAETVFWASTLSPHVNINRIELMPTTQAFSPLAVHRVPS